MPHRRRRRLSIATSVGCWRWVVRPDCSRPCTLLGIRPRSMAGTTHSSELIRTNGLIQAGHTRALDEDDLLGFRLDPTARPARKRHASSARLQPSHFAAPNTRFCRHRRDLTYSDHPPPAPWYRAGQERDARCGRILERRGAGTGHARRRGALGAVRRCSRQVGRGHLEPRPLRAGECLRGARCRSSSARGLDQVCVATTDRVPPGQATARIGHDRGYWLAAEPPGRALRRSHFSGWRRRSRGQSRGIRWRSAVPGSGRELARVEQPPTNRGPRCRLAVW